MPAERYYIDQPLANNQTVILKDNEFHHLVRVMRVRVGEEIELINGKGLLAFATVQEIQKDRALLSIHKVKVKKSESTKIILAQAIPKPNRLDFIIEKGTELGADEFWLFPSQHSVKKDFSQQQLERLQTQVISAMKQCGRLFIPKVLFKQTFEEALTIKGSLFFGDVDPAAPLFATQLQKTELQPNVIFYVGPESGFSEKETKLLMDHGALGVKLHENILRTDTAGIVALSVLEQWRLLRDEG